MIMRNIAAILFYCAAFLCEIQVCAQEEDVRFDKAACVAGYHEISPNTTIAKNAPPTFNVRWKTTAGEDDVILQVYREWAPIGVDRFYNLILDNYFNCAAFFRVVPDFVVQFGIASEVEETSKWSETILDDPVTQSNRKGTITYATAGASTRTSQLFINLKDNSRLDKQGFAPFGEIVSGMEIIEAIVNPTPNNSGGVSQSSYKAKGNVWVLDKYPGIDMIEDTALLTGEVPLNEPQDLSFTTSSSRQPTMILIQLLAASALLIIFMN